MYISHCTSRGSIYSSPEDEFVRGSLPRDSRHLLEAPLALVDYKWDILSPGSNTRIGKDLCEWA